MKRKNILLVNLTVFFASVTADGRIGDKCKIATSNLPGICKLGTDCPIVQQEAKQGIDPTLCGFHEIIRPIVCCPDDPFTDDKQAEPLPQNLLIPDTSSKRLSEKRAPDEIAANGHDSSVHRNRCFRRTKSGYSCQWLIRISIE